LNSINVVLALNAATNFATGLGPPFKAKFALDASAAAAAASASLVVESPSLVRLALSVVFKEGPDSTGPGNCMGNSDPPPPTSGAGDSSALAGPLPAPNPLRTGAALDLMPAGTSGPGAAGLGVTADASIRLEARFMGGALELAEATAAVPLRCGKLELRRSSAANTALSRLKSGGGRLNSDAKRPSINCGYHDFKKENCKSIEYVLELMQDTHFKIFETSILC
jgi:hypothetical protein